jgi:tRNA-dependent cyclodipeptide synthase
MTTDFGYSVRVKNGAGWRAYGRARLMISVGQPYHEGKKLEAAASWVNRNPDISEVHISVNDLLQRHNLIAAGKSVTAASAAALAEGSLWMARNQDIVASIKAPVTVTRWHDWIGHPGFFAASNALAAYADQDLAFADALATDAKALAARKTQRGEHVPDRLVLHSYDYVTEELSVFALQARALPAAEVYPGSNLVSAQYLIGKTLPEPIASLANRRFVRIDFARIDVAANQALRPFAQPKPG